MSLNDPAGWVTSLLNNMHGSDPEAATAAEFVRRRRTRVSVRNQLTGARWTIDRRIEIHPRYAELPPNDPYAISLMIHEVRHLQQGMLTALSVHGELEAWQLQFAYLKRETGQYHGDPFRETVIEQLMHLRLNWDRVVLENARSLMRAYAGRKYRIDLLPLFPLPSEIRYRLTRRTPLPRPAKRS
jgi:hypothetical protein